MQNSIFKQCYLRCFNKLNLIFLCSKILIWVFNFFFFQIEYPPEFRETFSSQTLEPGPSLSLKCIAGGNPLPQITWKLDDAPLPESPRVRFGDYVTKVSN